MKKSILPICINSPIQRFYTIFGGAFLLIVSLGGCKISGERGYEVNNLSSDTICVYFATGYYDFGPTAYPDTLLPEDKAVSGKYVGRLSESILGDFIPPHTKLGLYPFLLWDDEGMPKIPSLPKDTFSVFFIQIDTLRKYGYDNVRLNNRILVRYDLSISEVKQLNAVFTYPPQEYMRNKKMWPPYSYFDDDLRAMEKGQP